MRISVPAVPATTQSEMDYFQHATITATVAVLSNCSIQLTGNTAKSAL